MDYNTQSSSATAYIVGGLFFGDQGKGTTVQYLVKKYKANLVVRYNGGPQAMHHIVKAGDPTHWHCCAQFGAGTLINQNCKTLLSKYMLISPHTLLVEADFLADKGIPNAMEKICIDLDCIIITPLHKLLNQIKETLRGAKSYGTTGMGVGVAADDAFAAYPDQFPLGNVCSKKLNLHPIPTCLKVKDLLSSEKLESVLSSIFEQKLKKAMQLIEDFKDNKCQIYEEDYTSEVLSESERITRVDEANQLFLSFVDKYTIESLSGFYQHFADLMKNNFVKSAELIALSLQIDKSVVFQGAQGALLDKIHGFYPHLTRTLCSSHNAEALIIEAQKLMTQKVEMVKIGILRAYGSRHGNGPFVTEDDKWKEYITEDHNATSRWQGKFRIGAFDMVAAQYGCKIFKPHFISLTCIDKLVNAAKKSETIADLPLCFSYRLKEPGSFLNLTQVLEVEDDEINKVTGINLRGVESAYLSMDLSKAMNHSIPLYALYQEWSHDIQENEDLIKLLDSEMGSGVINRKIAKYIQKIEKSLKMPIGIISMGPSVAEKRDWALK